MHTLVAVGAAAAMPSSFDGGGCRCHLVIVLGCLLWLWMVVAVARFGVVGAHRRCGCLRSNAVAGCCGCACSCTGGGCSARLRAWAVGGCCGQSCHMLCTYHGCLCLWVVISRCWRWSLWVVGGCWGRLLLFINGGGKKKGSHVTHHDNGITFELPCEITCE